MENRFQVLQEKWTDFAIKLSNNSEMVKNYWDFIFNNYQEEHRYYHNLEHINDLLTHFDSCNEMIADSNIVLTSIWFHDIVYNPNRTDNEAVSATFAKKFLKILKWERVRYKKVEYYILRTANHAHFKSSDSNDLRLFLDFDLAILASEPDRYKQYIDKIRKEYKIVSDQVYYPKRRKFLKNFLKHKHIFHSEFFRKNFENQARTNIRNEIEFISKI